jgi:hypothetical protein
MNSILFIILERFISVDPCHHARNISVCVCILPITNVALIQKEIKQLKKNHYCSLIDQVKNEHLMYQMR